MTLTLLIILVAGVWGFYKMATKGHYKSFRPDPPLSQFDAGARPDGTFPQRPAGFGNIITPAGPPAPPVPPIAPAA